MMQHDAILRKNTMPGPRRGQARLQLHPPWFGQEHGKPGKQQMCHEKWFHKQRLGMSSNKHIQTSCYNGILNTSLVWQKMSNIRICRFQFICSWKWCHKIKSISSIWPKKTWNKSSIQPSWLEQWKMSKIHRTLGPSSHRKESQLIPKMPTFHGT